MRKFGIVTVTLAFLLSMLSLGGCNTVKGVGKDISSGGQAIEKGATSVQKKI